MKKSKLKSRLEQHQVPSAAITSDQLAGLNALNSPDKDSTEGPAPHVRGLVRARSPRGPGLAGTCARRALANSGGQPGLVSQAAVRSVINVRVVSELAWCVQRSSHV